MRLIIFKVLFLLFVSGCGDETEYVNKRTSANPAGRSESQLIEELKQRIKKLELFASTYTAGVTNPFEDCNAVTSDIEKKICQVAQTATATQQAETKSQLATIAKEFQETLYGVDCINITDVGCPVAGSLMSDMTIAEAAIATNSSDISSIQSTITTMQALEATMSGKLTALENRFNSFNGTASSIETIITGIQSDITSLQTDVASIKGIINASKVLNQYLLCGNNSDSGPIYEIILITGDKNKAFGSIKTGTWYGLGTFFTAGDTDKGFDTHLNSKTCRFKMYNNLAKTKIQACWVSTNRSASDAQIDAARTGGTATCTDW